MISVVCGKPLTVSLQSKSLVSGANGEGFIRVKVGDAEGKFVSKAKVVLSKASSEGAALTVNNQEFSLVAGENNLYELNLLNLKPDAGLYTIEVTATPVEAKNWEEGEGEFIIRVPGSVTVSDFQLVISDTTDSVDISAGKKHKLDFGKKLSAGIKVEAYQQLYFEWKVKGSTGKNVQVQQAFVRVSNEKLGREYFVVAQSTTKGYNAHLNLREAATEFYGQSGDYQIQLIIGDSFISNPTQWSIGTISVNYASDLKVEVPRSPFLVLPEIQHLFRQPEKRPPLTVSFAFTIATLAIPILVLFIGLGRVGANLSNFPTGGNFIWAVGFQGSVASVLALFALYWFGLNMVQTLGYLAVLSVPTLFFAHRNLNALSQGGKQHAE